MSLSDINLLEKNNVSTFVFCSLLSLPLKFSCLSVPFLARWHCLLKLLLKFCFPRIPFSLVHICFHQIFELVMELFSLFSHFVSKECEPCHRACKLPITIRAVKCFTLDCCDASVALSCSELPMKQNKT